MERITQEILHAGKGVRRTIVLPKLGGGHLIDNKLFILFISSKAWTICIMTRTLIPTSLSPRKLNSTRNVKAVLKVKDNYQIFIYLFIDGGFLIYTDYLQAKKS